MILSSRGGENDGAKEDQEGDLVAETKGLTIGDPGNSADAELLKEEKETVQAPKAKLEENYFWPTVAFGEEEKEGLR